MASRFHKDTIIGDHIVAKDLDDMELQLKAIKILLIQKGIIKDENELIEIIDSIKTMDKLE